VPLNRREKDQENLENVDACHQEMCNRAPIDGNRPKNRENTDACPQKMRNRAVPPALLNRWQNDQENLEKTNGVSPAGAITERKRTFRTLISN
jgi:hypothetical protein